MQWGEGVEGPFHLFFQMVSVTPHDPTSHFKEDVQLRGLQEARRSGGGGE